MANRMQKLGMALKDTKTRIVLIVTGIVIVIGLVIGWLGFRGTEGPVGAASVRGAPAIESIPGNPPSREYAKTQQQENILRAQEAVRTGTSAQPTIIRTTYIGGDTSLTPPSIAASSATATAGAKSAECSPEALLRARQAGVNADELRCKGCNSTELRDAGYAAGELMNVGYSAAELKAAGYGVDELRAAGFAPAELRAAGFTASALKAVGLTAGELVRAGFAPAELLAAGFTPSELSQAGINADQLIAAGISTQQLEAASISLKPSANLSKDCSPAALQNARKQGVSAAELSKLKCGVAALKAAGYTAQELRNTAGYTAKELIAAGFVAEDLKNAGFTAGELERAGLTAKQLKTAGYGADELRAAGFTATDLAKAGFSPDELKVAGFSDGELARAGLAPSVIAGSSAGATGSVSGATTSTPGGISASGVVGEIGAASSSRGVSASGAAINTGAAVTIPALVNPQDAGLEALQKMQQRQAEQLSAQERQDRLTQLQQIMSQQAGDLLASWSPPAKQSYIIGEPPLKGQAAGAGGAGGQAGRSAAASAAQLPIIKSGTVMFAVLDTAVNSDEPSPVLATIVTGPYKGARLIGQFPQRVNKKVVLSFNSINVPSLAKTIPISAVAIDPETARTALASGVDNHYFQRYGSLFASSFAREYAKATEESGSTTTFGGLVVSQTNPQYSVGDKVAMGLGGVGSQFAASLGSMFNRPPTITVDSGTGIGILFMGDVAVGGTAPIAYAAPGAEIDTPHDVAKGAAPLPSLAPSTVEMPVVNVPTQAVPLQDLAPSQAVRTQGTSDAAQPAATTYSIPPDERAVNLPSG